MTTNANKRAVTTLFAEKGDIYCHQVRIVLAEKGVPYELEYVSRNSLSEALVELNPAGSIPTLVDRDLVLFNAHIIMEYLDERFPHPSLMPVYPVARAQSRLMAHRIQREWYALMDEINRDPQSADAQSQLNTLREEVLSLGSVFDAHPFFMSEEFSLIDCYVAPLLWRMQQLGVKFTGAGSKAVKDYMARIFQRESFRQSLGDNAPRYLLDDKE